MQGRSVYCIPCRNVNQKFIYNATLEIVGYNFVYLAWQLNLNLVSWLQYAFVYYNYKVSL